MEENPESTNFSYHHTFPPTAPAFKAPIVKTATPTFSLTSYITPSMNQPTGAPTKPPTRAPSLALTMRVCAEIEDKPETTNLSYHDGTIQNLRLALISDSISRHQYLDCVICLHTGQWPEEFFKTFKSFSWKRRTCFWKELSSVTVIIYVPWTCHKPIFLGAWVLHCHYYKVWGLANPRTWRSCYCLRT
jgi:hypothetical protein